MKRNEDNRDPNWEEDNQELLDITKMKIGGYYRYTKSAKCLLYVMGILKDHEGVDTLVTEFFHFSMAYFRYKFEIQATPVIKLSEWEEISKEEYFEATQKLTKGIGA